MDSAYGKGVLMTVHSDDRLEALVARLLEDDSGRLTLTATLDLTRDSNGGQPPVLRTLRQAARQVTEDFDKRVADAIEAEIADLEEIALDAAERGVLGLVYIAHPDDDPATPRAESGEFTVVELAASVRSSFHAGPRPRIFEVAREGYLERPVALVTTDLHTMSITRVMYGQGEETSEVDWPARYLTQRGQRTARESTGGGVRADERGGGHSYVKQRRSVDEHRNLFANEAAEHLMQFVQDEDILVVEGVDEARQQLLSRLPVQTAERAVQLGPPDPNEAERDRAARLRAIGVDEQFREAAQRVEEWFSGASPNTVGGVEAVQRAASEGRVATLIVHQDATNHFGYAEDARLRESPVDASAVEEVLSTAFSQGAAVYFTDVDRVLTEQGGLIATARY